LDEFAKYQRDERGLSPNTTKAQRRQLKDFFKNLTTQNASLAQITIHDVDSYFSLKGRQGCCRLTIRTKAETLRSFFRYAASRRWCASSIAPGIVAARIQVRELAELPKLGRRPAADCRCRWIDSGRYT